MVLVWLIVRYKPNIFVWRRLMIPEYSWGELLLSL